MFWIGVIIAFLAGLATIGLTRDTVRNRFPRVRALHLDWVAVGLLGCGLVVSTLDHVSTEKKIASVEAASQSVRSFEIDFDIQFRSDWSGAPPQAPRVIVVGQSPVAETDISLKTGDVRTVELHMDKEPSFGPTEDGWVHTTFRVKAEPGSWIVGSNSREVAEIRKVVFHIYGLRLQDSRDGNFTIGAKSRAFINGRQVALMEFRPQTAALSELPLGDKNPEMSFNGHWAIKVE